MRALSKDYHFRVTLFPEVLCTMKEIEDFPLDYIKSNRSVFLSFMSFTFVPFSPSRWYILSHGNINYELFEWKIKGIDIILDDDKQQAETVTL